VVRRRALAGRIKLLDAFTGAKRDVHAVDAAWTLHERAVAHEENATTA
jgi:hypothetical protein